MKHEKLKKQKKNVKNVFEKLKMFKYKFFVLNFNWRLKCFVLAVNLERPLNGFILPLIEI